MSWIYPTHSHHLNLFLLTNSINTKELLCYLLLSFSVNKKCLSIYNVGHDIIIYQLCDQMEDAKLGTLFN